MFPNETCPGRHQTLDWSINGIYGDSELRMLKRPANGTYNFHAIESVRLYGNKHGTYHPIRLKRYHQEKIDSNM